MKTHSTTSSDSTVGSFTQALNFVRHAPMDEVTGFLHMLPSALRTREGVTVSGPHADANHAEGPTQHVPRQRKCDACGQGFTKTGNRQKYCKRVECRNERAAAYQRMHYHTTKRVRPNGDAHALPTMQEAASSLQA